ncbi:MAG: deoxyribose-phosphate aldolase [Actinobacteria bacterium]|nr:deoxyribose-phosphate aldolase [Actinomycetota bacterium]
MECSTKDIMKMIDHSLLFPWFDAEKLEEGCKIAVECDVASVCIMPFYVKRCAEILAGSTVKISTTVGFPHGCNTTSTKLAEAKQALDDGGEELDMVANYSKALSGDWDYVRDDIKAVVDVAHERGQKVKVIFENCYLTDDHKKKMCEICGEVRADWVKTSTGYGRSGATNEDLALMRKYCPEHVGVKSAGAEPIGVDELIEVRAIGVSRIGAYNMTPIIREQCKLRFGQ